MFFFVFSSIRVLITHIGWVINVTAMPDYIPASKISYI